MTTVNPFCRATIALLALTATVAAGLPDRGPNVEDGVVETFRERNGSIFTDWPKPQAVLVITGELDGYIEPCGCTGKENQRGALAGGRIFFRR